MTNNNINKMLLDMKKELFNAHSVIGVDLKSDLLLKAIEEWTPEEKLALVKILCIMNIPVKFNAKILKVILAEEKESSALTRNSNLLK